MYTYVPFLLAQMVMNLPAMQRTSVWSLDQKDPLEKGMATHPTILAWRIPWTEEPGGLLSRELQRVGHAWVTNTHSIEDKSFSSMGRLEFAPKTHHLSSNHLTSPNLRHSSTKWTVVTNTDRVPSLGQGVLITAVDETVSFSLELRF